MAALAANIGRKGRIVLMDDADHGFSGREGEVADELCSR